MLYLAIHHQPFHKRLTRISLPFGLKSSHPRDGKQADSLRVKQGIEKGIHTNPHSLCDGKAERCVCQTSSDLGSSEEAKCPAEEALHVLC